MVDILRQFRSAIEARGLQPKEIIADGKLHRCFVDGGKHGNLDGAYVLHDDENPAGGFENHRDGHGWQNWSAQNQGDRHIRRRTKTEVAYLLQKRDEETNQRHAKAAARAARILDQSRLAGNDHPYLVRKGVPAFGIRQLRDMLVIPARDTAGKLWTLEFIGPTGEKRFLSGGRKAGCYYAIGKPHSVLCVAEGFATAASIYRATGHATACAFDAGNLPAVARALRAKYPAIDIVVVADNDAETEGNPGVTHAMAAARAVGGRVAIPQFDRATS